jgi:thymidylate synthase (FAD)
MIEVVKPTWAYMPFSADSIDGIARHLEECGRTCYKSEDRITDDSAPKFVEKICRNNHESVLEHASISVRIVCSRSSSHQLVRHRIAAYSQESMRYCNYGKQDALRVICPPSTGLGPGMYNVTELPHTLTDRQVRWLGTVEMCYHSYKMELLAGAKPEDARYLLPVGTKTELVSTFNLRTWRHVFRSRAVNRHAQWEIRGIFSDMLANFKWRLPCVFGDIECGS